MKQSHPRKGLTRRHPGQLPATLPPFIRRLLRRSHGDGDAVGESEAFTSSVFEQLNEAAQRSQNDLGTACQQVAGKIVARLEETRPRATTATEPHDSIVAAGSMLSVVRRFSTFVTFLMLGGGLPANSIDSSKRLRRGSNGGSNRKLSNSAAQAFCKLLVGLSIEADQPDPVAVAAAAVQKAATATTPLVRHSRHSAEQEAFVGACLGMLKRFVDDALALTAPTAPTDATAAIESEVYLDSSSTDGGNAAAAAAAPSSPLSSPLSTSSKSNATLRFLAPRFEAADRFR